MSILNVNQIQPVGSGQTITISASDITASSATITASSVTATTVTSSSTSTFSSGLNVTGGSVGIGTDNPTYALQVHNSSIPRIHLTNDTTGTTTSDGFQIYANGNDAIILNKENSVLQFGTNNTTRATITSGGNVEISNGNLVFSTAGTGIDFSATANSSGTMTSELLSDYEEGTWTPVLSYTTPGTVSVGYATQQGYYTKVGNLVHFRAEIRLNAFTKGTASGELMVTGLPFTAKSVTGGHYLINLATYATPLPATLGQYPVASAYSTFVQFNVLVDNNAWISFPDPDGNAQYKVSGIYIAA